ncbi:zinc ABC transporter substrate-binding protein [Bacillus sp. FJAT-50079]|uniref:metal ABC transporter solute-binding protein, Zn/Mn family n=1 Tax=Bacillus sp. FJAT-50079 TaxID=2833577 RepID=UPI001BCA17C4|nr:zinc ABC transporter substrate-binding protein [Bacillus sp. FJAT-50079]MBS4210617.1 zinc ABC transporter substrate-binding protein [Bacillus sp. FJAT-50079]
MQRKLFLLLAVFILVIAAGCQKSEPSQGTKVSEDTALDVYTTVYPLQFITERIGGEYVDVKTVYPPGADEHTYEPTQRDMIKLADADLFLYIGLGLESFVGKAEETLKNENVSMLSMGDTLPIVEHHDHAEDSDEEHHDHADHADASVEEHHHDHENEADHEDEHDHDHDHGDIDPHVWIDPVLMKELANNVLVALSEKMPEQKQTFEKNYQVLTKELEELDGQFQEVVEQAKRKTIIVPHAAYGYWEQRYGIEQLAISGISSASEPSQKKLKNMIDLIKEEQVPYILYEQNINSKLADVVRAETGAEALHIHNLAVLTEDDIKNQDDYLSLMKRNIDVLKKALY